MIIDKELYKKIAKEVIDYSKDEVSKEELESFQSHIENKLKDFKPTLMFYGTYNSGKSTLINAIFGKEELAKTGDSPETSKIYEYEYNGYTIYDTPGINAPIEHERVTNEHLKKCEIILFVVSNNGSFEEEYIYKRISEIVKLNKPLLIVLNNKINLPLDSKELRREIDKINKNLSTIGDREGIKKIEDKVSLVVVDAKTALEGKIENEQELIDESNILQLEDYITDILKESGSKEVINSLNIYIENFINRVIDKLDRKIDNPELKKVEELLTFLENYRENSKRELESIVNRNINSFKAGIRDRILNESSKDDIKRYIESFVNGLTTQIEQKVEDISRELSGRIEQFAIDFNNIKVSYDESIISSINVGDSLEESIDSMDNLIKETLSMLQSDKIEELLKIILPTTISGILSKAIGVIGVLYGIWSDFDSHEKQIEEKRRKALNAKNSADEIARELEREFLKIINDIVNSVFNNLIDEYRKIAKELNSDNSKFIELKNGLLNLVVKPSALAVGI